MIAFVHIPGLRVLTKVMLRFNLHYEDLREIEQGTEEIKKDQEDGVLVK